MINLLPHIHKEELKLEETFRLVVILGTLSLLFLLCLALLLLSIRIYVFGEIRAQEVFLEAEREETGGQSVLGKIRSLNAEVNGLHGFYTGRVVLSDVISAITQAAPPGISLDSFTYTARKITLTGFAPTTEELLAFRERLQQDSRFGNFRFPFSNLVPAENIMFSFEFELL